MHAMDFKQSRRLWLENMLITEFELCSTQCLLATVAFQMPEQPVGNERGVVAVFMALEMCGVRRAVLCECAVPASLGQRRYFLE